MHQNVEIVNRVNLKLNVNPEKCQAGRKNPELIICVGEVDKPQRASQKILIRCAQGLWNSKTYEKNSLERGSLKTQILILKKKFTQEFRAKIWLEI